MALEARRTSGRKISLALNRSPTTAIPAMSPWSSIVLGSAPASRNFPDQDGRGLRVASMIKFRQALLFPFHTGMLLVRSTANRDVPQPSQKG